MSDRSALVDAMERLLSAWSATVRIPGDRQEMAITMSQGKAAVLLTAGEDDFYDLIAGQPMSGSVEIIHGGQPTEHPGRHCVSIVEAETCAVDFLDHGAVELPSPRWERQMP